MFRTGPQSKVNHTCPLSTSGMVPHFLRLLGSPSKAVVYSPTPPDRFPYDIFQSVFRCSKVIIVLFVSRGVRPRLMRRFPTDVGSRESERQAERELTNNCFHLTRNWIRARQAASIRQRNQLQYKCYPQYMDNASQVGYQTL